ncbi:MAG: hypothetical protein ABL993_16560, partial [Vicinamibacterales bacterium]
MAEAIPLVEQSGGRSSAARLVPAPPGGAGTATTGDAARDDRPQATEAQRGGGAAGLANRAASIGTFGRTSVNSIFSRPFSR